MTLVLPASDSPAHQWAVVAHELARLIERITDAGVAARGLSDAVDWHARAATVFHERATVWAGDVSGLVCVAETLRLEVDRARDRSASMEWLSHLLGVER